jgi:uncharacterized phage protein gp47/JayE
MADFEIPTVEEVQEAGIRSLNADFPELYTGEGTPARLETAATARMVGGNHAHISATARNYNPLTADEAGLALWAELLDVPRKVATIAARSGALEISGTPGSIVPAGTQLVHRTGQTFEIATTATLSAGGLALADVESISTGPNARLIAGEALRFQAAPAGVNQSARLVLPLTTGGEPIEPLGVWRARVVQRYRQPDQGGNLIDYQAWTLEASSAVRNAYVYPAKPSRGSVAVAGLREGEGSERVLNSTERTTVLDYLNTLRPVTDIVTVLETVPRKVHVDVQASVLPSGAFDWDDTSGYTVAAWDAGTSQLTFDPGVPAGLSPGNLLTISSADPDASGADGFPAVVSTIVSATVVTLAPYLDRSQPLSWTPTAGDDIYASSTTAYAIRTAITDGYTVGCGSAQGETFIPGINQLGPANPLRAYGTWESDVTRARLQAAVLSNPASVEVTVAAPVSDALAVEYAFPDTHLVELLTPGQIVVRRA